MTILVPDKQQSKLVAVVMFGNIKVAQASSLECEYYIGCERKFCEIKMQIVFAKTRVTKIK